MPRYHDTAFWRLCGTIATKLSRLGSCEYWKFALWYRTQGSSQNSQGVVDGGVNNAGVSTVAPDGSAQAICSSQQAASGVRCVMLAPCEMTQGVGNTCVSDLSKVTPRYLGSEQKGRVSLL